MKAIIPAKDKTNRPHLHAPVDIPHSFACIDKAKLLLGYKPLISFKEGLINTIEWYVNNHI